MDITVKLPMSPLFTLLCLATVAVATEILVRLGDTAILRCHNDRGQKVSWVKSDFQIVSYRGHIEKTEYPRYEIIGENEMKINDVRKSDNMIFHCRYRDHYLGNVTLVVVVPPNEVKITGSEGAFSEGHTVTLRCSADGINPKPKVKWMINGEHYPETSSSFNAFDTTYSELKLTNVDRSLDGAEVACKVTTRTIPKVPTISVHNPRTTLVVNHAPSTPTLVTSTDDLRAGVKVRVECGSSDGRPLPELKLVRSDGEKLSPMPLISDGKSQKLVVEMNLRPLDNGVILTCTATSILKSVQQQLKLDVMFAPIISDTIFSSQNPPTFVVGDRLSAPCDVESNPSQVSYEWFAEGSETVLSTSSLYVNNEIETRDKVFKCVASNIIGTSEKYFKINIQYAPITTVIDSNRNIVSNNTKYLTSEGDSLHLQCASDAQPFTRQIQWTKDGVVVSTDTQLHISSLSRSHSGLYRCTAENILTPSSLEKGQTRRGVGVSQMHLVVQYKPQKAEIEVLNVPIKSKGFSLKCSSMDMGEPSGEFEWLPPVATDPSISYYTDGNLFSVEAASSNFNVSCFAVNSVGKGGIATYSVVLKEYVRFTDNPTTTTFYYNLTGNSLGGAHRPPTFPSSGTASDSPTVPTTTTTTHAPSTSTSATTSSEVTQHPASPSSHALVLTCSARGVELPAVVWSSGRAGAGEGGDGAGTRKYSLPASTSVVTTISNRYTIISQLQFNTNEIKIDDGGEYTCSVNNSISVKPITRTFSIQLQYAPDSSTTETRVAAELGSRSQLVCSMRARPAVNIRWSANREQINSPYVTVSTVTFTPPDLYTSRVLFDNVAEEDMKKYSCIAANSMGTKQVDIELLPPSIPEPPSLLHVTSATWENIELQWTPGFHGGFRQHFEVTAGQGHRANDLEQNTYNFAGLYPNKMYNFTIKSVNQLGSSDTITLHHTTDDYSISDLSSVSYDDVSGELHLKFADVNRELCPRIRYYMVDEQRGPTWKVIQPCSMENFTSGIRLPATSPVRSVLVSLCLKRRQDICGHEIDARGAASYVGDQDDLPSSVIVIVGSVCGSIVLILSVILIVLCCRRHKARKAYEAENINHQSPVMTQQKSGDIAMYTPPVYGGDTSAPESIDKPRQNLDYPATAYGEPPKTKKVMYEVVV